MRASLAERQRARVGIADAINLNVGVSAVMVVAGEDDAPSLMGIPGKKQRLANQLCLPQRLILSRILRLKSEFFAYF
jgi:hypothetical protein